MELVDLVIFCGMAFSGTFDILCGMHKFVCTCQIHIALILKSLYSSDTDYTHSGN
jgi:hypothetical protein